jgi:hypothetical protein
MLAYLRTKKVDELAKAATVNIHPTQLNNQQHLLLNIQQIAQAKFKFNKNKKSISHNNNRLSTTPLTIFESIDLRERSAGSIIYQLWSGHCTLNK